MVQHGTKIAFMPIYICIKIKEGDMQHMKAFIYLLFARLQITIYHNYKYCVSDKYVASNNGDHGLASSRGPCKTHPFNHICWFI
jgi:hypothetical protein